ncbi:MAG: hypothetical protein LC112_05225 [Flavobacteriales bacterium]|nr:hypothetical protein [Flavobacteriales bacterium]
MKSILLKWIGILLIVSISFLIFSTIYKDTLPKIVEEINNSAIGAILTAFVTVLLLQGQTANEEKRDKSVKVFEKKQDVYHGFLEELKAIINDGKISLASYGENADLSGNVDELKDLLFQLGYIQMHTSEENTKKVFERVGKIIRVMNDFNSETSKKQEQLPEFYASLSEELFAIISILKNDLYGIDSNPIPREKVVDILKGCDLFVDNKELDQYEVQNYFWFELQKQLISKGYNFKLIDFTDDVNLFYSGSRKRHKFFGISFPIYKTKIGNEIEFSVEVENSYYYGFTTNKEITNTDGVIKTINETSKLFKTNEWWYGWKYSERYNLDFWKLDPDEFARLKNHSKRQAFILDIANEMDSYIKKFIIAADANNL